MQRIEITGNLGHDPELRFTPDGAAVCEFPVAHTDRRKNDAGEWEDVGDTIWFRVTLWRGRAEQAAEHLRKGDRVHVVGKVGVWAYTGKAQDGAEVPKARLEVQAFEVFKALPRQLPADQSKDAAMWSTPQRTPTPSGPPQPYDGEPPF